MSLLERRMQLLLSADQHARLEREARARGSSINAVVRSAIDEHLDKGVDARRDAFDQLLAFARAPDRGPVEDYARSKQLLEQELIGKHP